MSVAKQYQNQGLSLPVLISAGNSGLIKAVEKFDETRGFKLISYAVWWIRQSILQTLADESRTIRLPANKVASQTKIKKAFEKFEQEENRKPLPFELAEILDMKTHKVADSLSSRTYCVSLDAPITEDIENGNLLDVLANENSPNPDREVDHESLSTEIHRALDTLTSRESEILRMFFGIGYPRELTMNEIAGEFKMTNERVRQIKEKALKRLKHPSRGKVLKEYV